MDEIIYFGLGGHDRSDGGLITTVLEMAFAGNCGIHLEIEEKWAQQGIMEYFFAEELGAVLEVENQKLEQVQQILNEFKLPFQLIGRTTTEKKISIHLIKGTKFLICKTIS